MCEFESSQVSQAVRACGIVGRRAEKGPQLGGFRAIGEVPGPRNSRSRPPNSKKSPADSFEIPVLGSLRSETGFDRHCRPTLAHNSSEVVVPPPITLIDAIKAGRLIPYEYFPSAVNLTATEADLGRTQTEAISREMARNKPSENGILLLGTEEQVRLASQVASDMVAGRPIHTSHAREVSNSIAAFGFIDPPFIDETNNVLDGVVRVEAAVQCGLRSIPCIVAEHLSPSQRRLVRLAVNRLQEKGAWDLAELSLEFEELILEGAPLDLTGITVPGIDQITLDDDSPVTEMGPLEPDLTVPTTAKPGDIYILGSHWLICGDATDAAVMAALGSGVPCHPL